MMKNQGTASSTVLTFGQLLAQPLMPASRIQGKKAQTASGLEAPPDFTPDRLRELQPEWLLQLVKKAKQNYASILEQHTSTKVYAADLYLQSPDIYESTDEVNIRTLTSLQFGALFTELLPKCGFDVKFRVRLLLVSAGF